VQQTPTPERYQEIQQALIDKGFLPGPATGKWDTQSSDALRRFQVDQKLEPTGKLNALSLIRLGLGPKRAPVPANGLLVQSQAGGLP
jgi:peptidoglycan hydrolase-like protein with peptidoglycan-binding domain